jgi:hypothetical protein
LMAAWILSVSASAFAPCCPSGSGVLTKYKYYYRYNKDKNNRTNYFEKFFHYVKSFFVLS